MFEFQDRKPVPVAVLGATGSVGQKFVELLSNHPWFEIKALAASERSAGKKYKDATDWQMPTPLPAHIADLVVQKCNADLKCPLIFSALNADVAGEIEARFADAGVMVISNARSHRHHPHVPLIIPEVNAEQLQLLDRQARQRGGIVANPNCVVAGLALALKPLQDLVGIAAVDVTSFQSISGAGFAAAQTMNIQDNVIPYIAGEEEKIEREINKIFDDQVSVSAKCHRVPVSHGHLLSVGVKLKNTASREDLIAAWREFSSEAQKLELPMAPFKPIHYFEEESYPQPKLHRDLDKGMAASIGRLRPCSILDYKFNVLSHNVVRGAAGGAILTAELLLKKGRVFW